MSYRIERCTASSEEQEDLARFLAAFVRDGEGPAGNPEEESAGLWRNRMRGWWELNPFCVDDSPRGFAVRTEENEIVGFFGFIPHDYVENGNRVRGLIATTSFVREAHRSSALPLFMKAHRLEADYHYVDGAPNEAIHPILERFGYEHHETARMHLYPLRASLLNPLRWATGVAHLLSRSGGEIPNSGRLITDPAEASSIADFPDPELRRFVSLESLGWYLRSGTKPHFFAGWCDDDGVLQCYLLGVVRRKSFVNGLVIADYAFANAGAQRTLETLICMIASRPSEFLLPDSVGLIVWPTCEEDLKTTTPFQKSYDPRFFYRFPKEISKKSRHILPLEGDHIFQ